MIKVLGTQETKRQRHGLAQGASGPVLPGIRARWQARGLSQASRCPGRAAASPAVRCRYLPLPFPGTLCYKDKLKG
jgi:hypothetical protein